MNLLQIFSMALRLWRNNAAWYALAGLALFLTAFISAGLLGGLLIFDALVALLFGPAGAWIARPPVALTMAGITGLGLLLVLFFFFSGLGAFMHFCAQIGAGKKEINLLAFLEYGRLHGPSFWVVGLLEQAVAMLFALPVLLLGWALSSVYPTLLPVALLLALMVYFVAQLPFWLAFPAQIVARKGALASLSASVKASVSSPIGSLCVLLLISLMMALPAPLFIFYPIYFFLIFMPMATVLELVYFEATQGLIK